MRPLVNFFTMSDPPSLHQHFFGGDISVMPCTKKGAVVAKAARSLVTGPPTTVNLFHKGPHFPSPGWRISFKH